MKIPRRVRHWFSGPIGWGRSVLLVVVAGGLMALVIAAIDDAIVSRQHSTLVKVPCSIESSNISREAGRDARNLPGWHYVPTVRYHYEFNGKSYESDVVCSRTTPITSKSVADAFMQKYGPGASAECHVDPDDPDIAMLELPNRDGSMRTAKFGGLAIGLAVCGLLVLQAATTIDLAPRRRRPRAPGWGEADSGPQDPLKRTRQLLRDRIES